MVNIIVGDRVNFISILFTYFIHKCNMSIDQVVYLGLLVLFAFYIASFLSVKTWKLKFLLGYVYKEQILVTNK